MSAEEEQRAMEMLGIRPKDRHLLTCKTGALEGVATIGIETTGDLERGSSIPARAHMEALDAREHDILVRVAREQRARDADRTKKSTEAKREQAEKHFSGKWLAEAHLKNPDQGAERLALSARRLLAAQPNDPDYPARAEITEHRAKQFRKTKKNSGDM